MFLSIFENISDPKKQITRTKEASTILVNKIGISPLSCVLLAVNDF